ncbi:hypothetical protein [Marinibactrum halimedae]|uniref:Uncharacterized protein n=1 Tax=Marinibactrum halimedae TaxID=1444977 RepID=A0AA37WQK6_9GAMM|nr:hypothetical protein [Marinibactrum halimedae]MCD9459537.1 hypothetical protein [Marinibactrum halimedae]GLS28191.1 hypothetical protein GCM10007877_39100 [Marinibactrum halimedae]
MFNILPLVFFLLRLIVVVIMFAPFSSLSQALNCEPLDPRQHVGKKAEHSIEGSAKALFKVAKGEINYKNKTQEEINNLYQSYPNADRIVIQGKLIYTFCTALNDAKDMKPSDKLEKLNNFMSLLIGTPTATDKPTSQKEKNQYIAELDEFVFELKQCKGSGSAIRCYFIVTNVGQDRSLGIYGNYGASSSRLFLASGDEVLSVKSQLGASESKQYVSVNLISGIPVKASLHFKASNIESNKIAALEVKTKGGPIQFRGITLAE